MIKMEAEIFSWWEFENNVFKCTRCGHECLLGISVCPECFSKMIIPEKTKEAFKSRRNEFE